MISRVWKWDHVKCVHERASRERLASCSFLLTHWNAMSHWREVPQIRHWLNLHTYVALLIIMSSTASKWLVLPWRREGRGARIYQRHRHNMHRIKQSTLLKVVQAFANYTAWKWWLEKRNHVLVPELMAYAIMWSFSHASHHCGHNSSPPIAICTVIGTYIADILICCVGNITTKMCRYYSDTCHCHVNQVGNVWYFVQCLAWHQTSCYHFIHACTQ